MSNNKLTATQVLELQTRAEHFLRRAESYSQLMKKLEWKGTGGHPDQHNPDPLWRDAYNAILLLTHDLGQCAVLLGRTVGYNAVDPDGIVPLASQIREAQQAGAHELPRTDSADGTL